MFRVIMNRLADYEPQSVRKHLSYVAEYGRWDDILCLMGTVCEPVPASVVLSLGIYFAAHYTGLFHDPFITFSSKPQPGKIKGENLYSKVRSCASFDEVADTNLQGVFEGMRPSL